MDICLTKHLNLLAGVNYLVINPKASGNREENEMSIMSPYCSDCGLHHEEGNCPKRSTTFESEHNKEAGEFTDNIDGNHTTEPLYTIEQAISKLEDTGLYLTRCPSEALTIEESVEAVALLTDKQEDNGGT